MRQQRRQPDRHAGIFDWPFRDVLVHELIGFIEPRGQAPCDATKRRNTMLVLSRRVGERIFFPGIGAYVKVVAVNGGTVRLSIEAPPEILILRGELCDRRDSETRVDAGSSKSPCD
jgi:carbon storage regulator CsrA